MKIRSLSIENFRAISSVKLIELYDAVVIAGPNGCGKSCIFDAIRLLKSAYGQYNQNEWQSWFQEFQINVQNISREAKRVLRKTDEDLKIEADFTLSENEKDFLRNNGEALIKQTTWSRALGRRVSPDEESLVVSPGDRRLYGDTVEKESAGTLAKLMAELEKDVFVAALKMGADGEVLIAESPALEMVFSTYAPSFLGVIDYHGANRTYSRERVGSVNLSIGATDQRMRQHALYNTQNKYTNIKTEMASAFVQDVLSREAGLKRSDGSDLIETLKELFELFFPGKTFLGPQPTTDGGLLFPVELSDGSQHDIDELSSGEKEVLLGYLRLRNNAPKDSVILIDEPELHLNPRLIKGLPRFYQKHLGEAFNNQLWMITHSDTLLRESIDEPSFSVHHMQPALSIIEGANQVHPLSASEEVERAVIDLVGDLATYSPHSKVVILEGGGESEFDVTLVHQLFPDFGERVNLISGGSKKRVLELHDLLKKASADGHINAHFFSVIDRDFDGPKESGLENRYQWDVYHIENYLLHTGFIHLVIESLQLGGNVQSEDEIYQMLQDCAKESIDNLVCMKLEQYVNHSLISCIRTSIDPNSKSLAEDYRAVADRSVTRLFKKLESDLLIDEIRNQERELREELTTSLENGQWLRNFRGRDILKKFTTKCGLGVGYEKFRNLIVSRMRMEGYCPEGMKVVIDEIINS